MTEFSEASRWLGGRLSLRQPPRGAHRAGTDALLLAYLFEPGPNSIVCDLGAATGAVGLAYAALHPHCRVVLVERDEGLVALARENVRENGLGERVSVLKADVLARGVQRREAGLTPDLADILVTNPPFYEDGCHRPSPVAGKASAHSFSGAGLETWMRACADLLRPGGRIGLIHRADRLPDCLSAMRKRFGGVAARPVQTAADRAAIRILITAVKGSRAAFSLLPAIVLRDGRVTEAQPARALAP